MTKITTTINQIEEIESIETINNDLDAFFETNNLIPPAQVRFNYFKF